jgi:chemotaxis signal transduction protein
MNEDSIAISTSSISAGEGTQSLEQLSDEEFWQYARELAYKTATSSQPEGYVECILSRERYLISLSALYEVILPPHRFALLPAMPPWMIGVVAWRGETIAVIDLEAYLAGSSEHLLHEGILLIANHGGLPLGLVVPSIGQPPPLETEALVLDLAALLTDIVQQIGTAASDG